MLNNLILMAVAFVWALVIIVSATSEGPKWVKFLMFLLGAGVIVSNVIALLQGGCYHA